MAVEPDPNQLAFDALETAGVVHPVSEKYFHDVALDQDVLDPDEAAEHIDQQYSQLSDAGTDDTE